MSSTVLTEGTCSVARDVAHHTSDFGLLEVWNVHRPSSSCRLHRCSSSIDSAITIRGMHISTVMTLIRRSTTGLRSSRSFALSVEAVSTEFQKGRNVTHDQQSAGGCDRYPNPVGGGVDIGFSTYKDLASRSFRTTLTL